MAPITITAREFLRKSCNVCCLNRTIPARLTDVEYFVAKSVSRKEVPLKDWNKYYHDHEVEIATGRVQILDMPEAQAKEVAAVAAQTDGIIFHLWPDGAKAPNGVVGHPQSVGHKHRTK
ncbi:MAG: DUF1264 domain-containing protein [Nitrospiraceae bacterium]